jgi:hypothetical protein
MYRQYIDFKETNVNNESWSHPEKKRSGYGKEWRDVLNRIASFPALYAILLRGDLRA